MFAANTPTILTVFGVTGDLSTKKILPSLWHLYKEKRLPKHLKVIGIARKEMSEEDWYGFIEEAISSKQTGPLPKESFRTFCNYFVYEAGDLSEGDTFNSLRSLVDKTETEWGVCTNKLFYLSVPPSTYETIFSGLAEAELNQPCGGEDGWSRLLVEKPLGSDGKSADALEDMIARYFKEEQIYRIDHYLFKEILQGVENFRFSNNLFESTWDKDSIERIDLRLCESIGVESRGRFYESVGALRDVGQNHLLEMLAAITMEYPADPSPEKIQRNRAKILKALRPWGKELIKQDTARYQHEGYKEIENVDPESNVETYFALKTELDHPRWEGVPIYMEAGKRLGQAQKEIVLTLRHPKVCHLCEVGAHGPNRIIFRFEPNDEILIDFWTKKPGFEHEIEERTFSFFLYEHRTKVQYVEEYSKVLNSAMAGKQSDFIGREEIEALWRFTDPVVNAWSQNLVPLQTYEPGEKPVPELLGYAPKTRHEVAKTVGEIGIVGLGKMGANLALQLRENHWQVSGYNKSTPKNKELKASKVEIASSLPNLVSNLKTPRLIWLMVPHQATDEVIETLAPLLEKGDTIIDGGNSFYKDSVRRAASLKAKGIKFLDVGVSGGPEGARHGACLMIGGGRDVYEANVQLLQNLAVESGYAYVGESGAGHFVKMVHNGIEYGMMQALGEGFAVMKETKEFDLDLHSVAKVYNHGSVITSSLVGWLAEAYQKFSPELNTDECCVGSVSHSGEGQWTVETAKELGVPVKIIEGALEFRKQSTNNPSYTGQVVSALRHEFGGHDTSRKSP